MIRESRIDIAIPSTYAGLGLVRNVLASIRDEVPLPAETMLKLEVCVIEAVGNSIRHAHDLKPDGSIRVSFRMLEERFVVEVTDSGRTMSAEAQNHLHNGTPPPAPNTLAVVDIPEGGMGFPIMRSVTDELDYESADGRNTLRMTLLHPSRALSAK